MAICSLLFGIACLGVGKFAPDGFMSIPDNIFSINFAAFTQNFVQLSDVNIPNTYQNFFGKIL
ncbi:MAG: hypothetical protein WCI00_06775 [bacterium]